MNPFSAKESQIKLLRPQAQHDFQPPARVYFSTRLFVFFFSPRDRRKNVPSRAKLFCTRDSPAPIARLRCGEKIYAFGERDRRVGVVARKNPLSSWSSRSGRFLRHATVNRRNASRGFRFVLLATQRICVLCYFQRYAVPRYLRASPTCTPSKKSSTK